MLAEDYFGFLNKRQIHTHKRTHKRTELSEEKMSSRERTRREDEIGLENLKKKYNEIIKKTKKKTRRKTSTNYRGVQDHYYHANKMKYYHYNDDGYDEKTKRIKERVEAKALMAFQRTKTQTHSEPKSVRKVISFQRPQNKVINIPEGQSKILGKSNYPNIKKQQKSHSSCSNSRLLQESCRGSRVLKKVKNQDKERLKKQDSSSKFDDYNLSSMKLQSQIQNSAYRSSLIKSKVSSSSRGYSNMDSMIGIDSKISNQSSENSFVHKKESSSSSQKNISSDYLQIKRMEMNAEKETVNLLHNDESEKRKSLTSQNNINESNKNSESSLCLSNMIAESARIFNPTFNNKNENGKKGSFIKKISESQAQQIESILNVQKNHPQIRPPKIDKINESQISRLNCNQSKVSSIINPSVFLKPSPRTFKQEPSSVEEMHEDLQSEDEKVKKKVSSFHDDFSQQIDFSSRCMKGKPKKNFNLAESIKLWNYHEKNNSKTDGGKGTNSKFEETMNNIHFHLKMINILSDFVEMTAEMYQQNESPWIELQSFVIYKKFYHQRVKVLDSLRGKQSCFHLGAAKISTESLTQFSNKKGFLELANNVQQINSMIEKSLLSYYSQIKPSHEGESVVNLDKFKDKDLGLIMNMLNEEFENILPRLDELENNSQENEDREIICLRGFRIMEVVFLLSELWGRRVKKLECEEVQAEDFEIYCKQYYGVFKETILYFS